MATQITGGLDERAMLVSLSISQWRGARTDRKIAAEAERTHGAKSGTVRASKVLLPEGAESLKAVEKAASAIREAYYRRTAPWADRGERILANEGYLAFCEEIRKLSQEFDAAATRFADEYPELVEKARVALNGLFRAADYPPQAAIRAQFRVTVETYPIPTANDFRVKMSEEHAALIREQLELNLNERSAAAAREGATRLLNALGHLMLRLQETADADGNPAPGTRLSNALWENVREVVDAMPGLNLAGDPKLAAETERLRKTVLAFDADQVRKSATERARAIEAAKGAAEAFRAFLA